MSHLEDHLHIVALAESSDSVVHIRWARRWDEVVVLQREKLESEKIEKKTAEERVDRLYISTQSGEQ